MSTIKNVLKGVLWAFGVLLILSNLGVNVNSLIAGLGIGGIAIALAAQNILGDLFSSLAIIIDKPFVPGDFIVVGDHKGIVEKVGIKTTRIRALQGEEIVISNQELTSSRIQNFKKMKERRINFGFGVVYDTDSNKLETIPATVKNIIDKQKLARFDRANFVKFADSSLNFEIVYYLATGEYKDYADTHEAILYEIKRIFEEQKIDMAYPTQTVYVRKE